ncbi:sigma-54 dependent transcriptional regulator [candidate division KSB1 bacterium]|nr:sigma-54 dependent transcriptional regulator [candidate division KSB1 bacterium]
MSNLGRILIADDETTFLEATADLFHDEGFECDVTADAYMARKMLCQKEYDLLIADIRMPGNLELELIQEIQEIAAGLPAILVTGYASLDTAILSTRLPVAGYLLKPLDFDELLKLAREAIARYQAFHEFYSAGKRRTATPPGQQQLGVDAVAVPTTNLAAKELTVRESQNTGDQEYGYTVENIVAHSVAMQNVIEIVKKAAPTDSNVLIFGETGVGKELIAHAIHHLSRRKEGKFVPVDCVAVPSNLLESELFGYEKGAFTGASRCKHGLFEFADHGTLFFDEISELEMSLQAKLLRVLQERQFRRLGGKELIAVDVRVIAAMNRNPNKALAAHCLRRDLYYRLNVIPIFVPPLRDRIDDIPDLVKHFIRTASARNRSALREISPEAMERLETYRWPGNVRHLKNIIERAVSLSRRPVIETDDLPAYIKFPKSKGNTSIWGAPYSEAKKRHLEQFEKKYLKELLRETNHDIAKAAQIAGMSERTIYRMISRYGKS